MRPGKIFQSKSLKNKLNCQIPFFSPSLLPLQRGHSHASVSPTMAAAAQKEPYAEYIKHTPACCIHCIFLPASRQNFSDAEIAQTLDLLGNVERYPNTDLVEYGQHGQWAMLRA